MRDAGSLFRTTSDFRSLPPYMSLRPRGSGRCSLWWFEACGTLCSPVGVNTYGTIYEEMSAKVKIIQCALLDQNDNLSFCVLLFFIPFALAFSMRLPNNVPFHQNTKLNLDNSPLGSQLIAFSPFLHSLCKEILTCGMPKWLCSLKADLDFRKHPWMITICFRSTFIDLFQNLRG